MKIETVEKLLDLKSRKQQVALVTELASGAQDLFTETHHAPALNLFDVEHMLGQLPDLLLAGRQVFHQAGFFGRHETAFGGRGQQLLLARQPLIGLRKTELHYTRGSTVGG